MFKKIKLSYAKHAKTYTLLIAIAAALGLLFTTLYSGWHANLLASTDSDGIVNTYLFQSFQIKDMIVPGNHTLLIKWPLFAIQSLFTYNFTSYAILNFLLLFGTIVGWLVGLTLLFGKRHFVLICIGLSVILLGTSLFPYSLLYGSLRNIEYPIGLFYILAIRSYLSTKIFTRKHIAQLITAFALFTLAASGDSLMVISFAAPLFVIGLVYWIKGGKLNKKILYALAGTFASIALALIIQRVIPLTGIALLHFDSAFNPVIVRFELLWPSLAYAFEQLFNLIGASIAGKAITPANAIYFFKFATLALGIIGLIVGVVQLIKAKTTNMLNGNTLAYGWLGISFFTTFLAYVLFGMAYNQLPDGTLVDAGSVRYIELLPLLTVAGLILLFLSLPKNRQYIVLGLFMTAAFGIALISMNAIRADTLKNDEFANARIATQKEIASILKKNDVQFLGSGYWDGATTRFWAQDTIDYVSISSCNVSGPDFNTRSSWLNSGHYDRSALLVDRHGRSAAYWGCTDQQILDIYGAPKQVIAVDASTNSPTVWLYDYDIRSKFVKNY